MVYFPSELQRGISVRQTGQVLWLVSHGFIHSSLEDGGRGGEGGLVKGERGKFGGK